MMGSRLQPTMADFSELKYVMRCVNESMRLYPHPPVLLRRALVPDTLPGGYEVTRGQDVMISVRTPLRHTLTSYTQQPDRVRTRTSKNTMPRMLGCAVHPWAQHVWCAMCCRRCHGRAAHPAPCAPARLAQVYNIHHSEAVWENPEAFEPERFPLDQPVPTELTTDFRWAGPAAACQPLSGRPGQGPWAVELGSPG